MKIKKLVTLFILIFLFNGCTFLGVNKNEKISRYFTMGEAVHSSTAKRKRIRNVPNWEERSNIRYTARRLDEVRKILGRPVIVTSWFRSERLNRAVGGSSTSRHRNGTSVDILLKKGKAGRREFEKVRARLKSFDQLIYYPRRGHLHVGFRAYRSQERQQVMIR